MSLTRRALLTASEMLLVPSAARANSVTDAARRIIQISQTFKRVFSAGPPAENMLYTLAPALLLGWPRANRAEECAFMLRVGRLMGRDARQKERADLIDDAGALPDQ
jgi:iron complex transport system substrate-binding protein